jgi:hypothetical protein
MAHKQGAHPNRTLGSSRLEARDPALLKGGTNAMFPTSREYTPPEVPTRHTLGSSRLEARDPALSKGGIKTMWPTNWEYTQPEAPSGTCWDQADLRQ